MTRDDLAKLYEKANGWNPAQHPTTMQELERFATLIQEATLEKNNLTWVANCQHLVKAEREACAQVCEAWGSWLGDGHLVANAIRTRVNKS